MGCLLVHELDIVAEDGGKEVGFGAQGQIFYGEVVYPTRDEFDAACIETNGEIGDALRMSAFHGIGDAKNGGDFLKTESIRLIESGVKVIFGGRCAMAVVARKHADELDISSGEAKDFRVEDDVLTVAVVGLGVDEGSNLM